jgi:hypothetical protein
MQPFNSPDESLLALERAVVKEEHRQSKMGGHPDECILRAMNEGGIPALMLSIKDIKRLLNMVLPHTHPFSEHIDTLSLAGLKRTTSC